MNLTTTSGRGSKSTIEHVLKQAGASRPLFSESATAQIHSISRGIPRVINNLCAACLLDVIAQGGQLVDVANVQRAQLDYEQL